MSTSSSKPWPWVGVIAVAFILLADALVFRALAPWPLLLERASDRYSRNVIEDRIQLQIQAQGQEGARTVALFGSSRLQRIWRTRYSTLVNRGDLRLLDYAHPRMSPADLLSAAEAMAGIEPDVVIVGLSELELHTSPTLSSRSSFPSIRRFADLTAIMGWDSLWKQRQELFRTAAGKLLLSYRFRDQLDSAGLMKLREFPGTRKSSSLAVIPLDTAWLLQEARTLPADWNSEFSRERLRRWQINDLVELKIGAGLELQKSFVRKIIRRFTRAGSRVVILELPVYPAARRLYDPEMRSVFLEFGEQMEREFGVRLIPIEKQPQLSKQDFADLMHVGKRASSRLTPFIDKLILEELARH